MGGYRYREEPHTEFKELLASMPVESVKPLCLISMGDPQMTSTLLQAAAEHDNKEAVLLLLEHGVDPKETSDIKKTPMKLAAATIRFKWEYEWKDVSLLQYLASQTAKLEQLELLLNHGLDPRAVTEDVDYTPLEIAACKENTKAFDLLAPHYEESIKKKIAQLFIWGLTDKAPSAAFMLLFESVPLAEVNNCTIFESNLLQALSYEGKTPHVAFLLEQGVDPEVCKETSKRPMHLAWLNDHVGTMTELAKYGVEPDSEVRG